MPPQNTIHISADVTAIQAAVRKYLPYLDALAAANPALKRWAQIAHLVFDDAPAAAPAAGLLPPGLGELFAEVARKLAVELLQKFINNAGAATVG